MLNELELKALNDAIGYINANASYNSPEARRITNELKIIIRTRKKIIFQNMMAVGLVYYGTKQDIDEANFSEEMFKEVEKERILPDGKVLVREFGASYTVTPKRWRN